MVPFHCLILAGFDPMQTVEEWAGEADEPTWKELASQQERAFEKRCWKEITKKEKRWAQRYKSSICYPHCRGNVFVM